MTAFSTRFPLSIRTATLQYSTAEERDRFGIVMRTAMAKQNIRRQEVADRTDLSAQCIGQVEQGKRGAPDTLLRIARALGFDADEAIGLRQDVDEYWFTSDDGRAWKITRDPERDEKREEES